MYTVPKHALQIINEWAAELSSRFDCSVDAINEQSKQLLSFPIETVRIELMDDSVVEFKYAFYLVNEEQKAIAVFTEHCGHHIFPYHDAKVFCDGNLMYAQKAS
jgi:hypothetical protein